MGVINEPVSIYSHKYRDSSQSLHVKVPCGLRGVRGGRGIYAKQVCVLLHNIGIDITETVYRSFETGYYLMSPYILDSVCEVLSCKPSDVYPEDVISLIDKYANKQ